MFGIIPYFVEFTLVQNNTSFTKHTIWRPWQIISEKS